MKTTNSNDLIPNSNGKGKANHFKTEQKKVLEALKIKPMTMKEVFVETGVMRENICRYVVILLETGRIKITQKRKCTITGHTSVNEYTGNPELFPKTNQLNLFDDIL